MEIFVIGIEIGQSEKAYGSNMKIMCSLYHEILSIFEMSHEILKIS